MGVTASDFDALGSAIAALKENPARDGEFDAVIAQVEAIRQELELDGVLEVYEEPPRRGVFSRVVSGLFYTVIMASIAALLVTGSLTESARSIMGYSIFTVLTRSMHSVLPKDSMLLVKQVDPESLDIGDDITYLYNDKSGTITHRIIAIHEDYEGSGMRAFQTQGVDNPRPDANKVYAVNVVGRVIYSVPYVGLVLRIIHENIYLLLVLCALVIGLVEVLRRLAATRRPRRAADPPPPPGCGSAAPAGRRNRPLR